MSILFLTLAATIGLSLGLLGGGGSILTVPVLVYVLGIPAKTAIAMSLPVVGVTSAISAGMHWRLGNVRVATALVAARVPQATLKRAFGVFLLLMGAFVLYQNRTVFL